MVLRALIWLLAASVISGCATTSVKKKPIKPNQPQTLMDVYAESVGQSRKDMNKFIEQKLTEQQTYGYVKPYVPVVEAPVVRKVWVPDHKSNADPDVLVAGHWTYVMVEGPKWFIDTEKTEDIPPEILTPAQPVQKPGTSLGFKKGRK